MPAKNQNSRLHFSSVLSPRLAGFNTDASIAVGGAGVCVVTQKFAALSLVGFAFIIEGVFTGFFLLYGWFLYSLFFQL